MGVGRCGEEQAGGRAANTPAKSARKSDKDGRDSRTTGRRVGCENDGRDKAE